MNLFRVPEIQDGDLGRLVRKGGFWRGSLTLGQSSFPLALCGSRREPDPEARAAARVIATSYDAWRPQIAKALYEHYLPYRDALSTGAAHIAREPDEIWSHAELHSVAVDRQRGVITTEFAYGVRWDDDHTLGARFQSGRLVELCGSILPA